MAEDDNPHYDGVAEILDNVTESKTSAEFPNPPTLLELLAYDLEHYYTYNGSLTTPPCSEVVVWIDFKEPIPLSHRQVITEVFQTFIYRPIVYHRKVQRVLLLFHDILEIK